MDSFYRHFFRIFFQLFLSIRKMFFEMLLQSWWLWIFFITSGKSTYKWFFPSMCAYMFCQMILKRKLLAILKLTKIKILIKSLYIKFCDGFEIWYYLKSEISVTNIAWIRLLPAMNPHMLCYSIWLSKSF